LIERAAHAVSDLAILANSLPAYYVRGSLDLSDCGDFAGNDSCRRERICSFPPQPVEMFSVCWVI
jgi:hypothetical protein